MPEIDKRIGDGVFAYWTGDMAGNTTADLKYIRDTAQYNYDNSKIYTEELLQIADQTPKLIKDNLVDDANININKMKNYIAAIGMESDQIESLGWVLTQQKNKHKHNLKGLFQMVWDWLDSIEQSVDQTDADTRYIHELVQKLNTNVLLGELMLKVEDLVRNLRRIDMKAHVISENVEFKKLEESLSLDKWKNYMSEFNENLKSNIRDKQSKSPNARIGFFVLCLVGAIGLGGFVYLYMRLQKAINSGKV